MSQIGGENQALLSVRIVSMDYYLSKPVQDLDVTYSTFRSSSIKKVPVIRVFGSTLAGQKTCLHLHGIFPYIYVPAPAQAPEGFVYRLAASIDKALNIGLAAGGTTKGLQPETDVAETNIQHVFKITEVSGKPFYGYHPREHLFFKVYFYNPWMLKRASDMLQSGAILGQIFQPHYSHVPYILQFMMDYNLQGMNPIHLKHAKFRSPDESEREEDSPSFSSEEHLRSFQSSERIFEMSKIPSYLFVSKRVSKISTCEIEVDAKAPDILNSNQSLLSTSVLESQESEKARLSLMNPGLEALCREEIERRQRFDLGRSITPPSSPKRGEKSEIPTSSQEFWSARFKSALTQLLPIAKKEPEPNQSSLDPDSTVLFDPQTKLCNVYPAESPEGHELPDATFVEDHVGSMSLSSFPDTSGGGRRTPVRPRSRLSVAFSLDDDPNKEKYFNDTHVDLNILNSTLAASQTTKVSSQGNDDDELLDILQELEQNRENLLDGPQASSSHEEEQDNLDTLEMTQVCWDIDPHLAMVDEDHSSQETVQEISETEGHQSEISEDLSFSLPPSTNEAEDERVLLQSQEEETGGDSPEHSASNSSSETWKDKTFWSNIDIESLCKSPKSPEQP